MVVRRRLHLRTGRRTDPAVARPSELDLHGKMFRSIRHHRKQAAQLGPPQGNMQAKGHRAMLSATWPPWKCRSVVAHRQDNALETVGPKRQRNADHRGNDRYEARTQNRYQATNNREANGSKAESEHDVNLSFFRSLLDHSLPTDLQKSSRMSQGRSAPHVRCGANEPGATPTRSINTDPERGVGHPTALTIAAACTDKHRRKPRDLAGRSGPDPATPQ